MAFSTGAGAIDLMIGFPFRDKKAVYEYLMPGIKDRGTDDLAMPDQAAVLSSAKKSEVVTFLTGLFAAPFATLTDDQRQRVIDWCPAELGTPEAPAVDQVCPLPCRRPRPRGSTARRRCPV